MPTGQKSSEPFAFRDHTVLVIDDEPSILKIIADFFEHSGLELLLAQSGQEGLTQAAAAQPDLILLDVLMPDLDGFEICRRLKENEATWDIPVIFLTALADIDNKLKGFEAGGVDYITKPFRYQEVLARVTTHLRLRNLTQDLEAVKQSLEQRVEEQTAVLARMNMELMAEIAERRRVEEALKESERLHRITMQNISDPVFLTDDEGRFTFICANVSHILGYTEAEMWAIGNIKALVGDNLFSEEQLARQGEISNIERVITNKAGQPRAFLVNVKRVAIGSGTTLYTCRDITDRKRTEQALRESEEKYRVLFNSFPLGITVTDAAGNILETNNSAEKLLKVPKSEHEQRHIASQEWQIIHPDGTPMPPTEWTSVRALAESRRLENVEEGIVTSAGEVTWLSVTAAPIPLENFGVVIAYSDITERKQMKDNLQLQAGVLQHMSEGVSLTKADGVFMFTNPRFEAMFGYEPGELLGQHVSLINAPGEKSPAELAAIIQAALKQTGAWSGEIQNIKKDGTIIWCQAHVANFVHSQYGQVWVSVHEDITERKQAEEQIRVALAEKETLLRELYHRTKNNMQVIISMLKLEAARTDDERLWSTFSRLEHKIQAMALVQQRLYQTRDLSRLNLKDYIHDLVHLLVSGYAVSPEKIKLTLELDDIVVLFDVAIPCGLILTELISNALRHAFPGDSRGEITIQLRHLAGEEIMLRVADNGVEVPNGFDFTQRSSLGLQMIRSIGERQLRGEVTFQAENGVSCQIRFKNNLYKPRV